MKTIHIMAAVCCFSVLSLAAVAQTTAPATATTGETQPAAAVTAPAPVAAPVTGSLWAKRTQPQNLYTDTVARKVGDLLTVIVSHESSSSTTAKHATDKGINIDAGAGAGWFDKFTGFGVKTDRTTAGSGSSSASTRIEDRITVTVIEIQPNGNLRIQGTRKIKMEKDEMQLILTGTVRPNDIANDNTISSALVADQSLEEKGSGPIAEKRRPGILSRLLEFLW